MPRLAQTISIVSKQNNGKTLVLEVKGIDDERNRSKRAAMAVWIRTVNEQGGFGQGCFGVVFEPARTRDVLLKQASECKNGE
ncbi:MAG: hypothetical protein K2Q45_00820 [Nitrosomonas sp.]|nr:hypothetical protein [Nitrosomonas sp.]